MTLSLTAAVSSLIRANSGTRAGSASSASSCQSPEISRKRAAGSARAGRSSRAAASSSASANRSRRFPPSMPTGCAPSQIDSSAPARPRRSAKTLGHALALRVSTSSRAHLRQAGREKESDAADRWATQSRSPSSAAAASVASSGGPEGRSTCRTFRYEPTRARAASNRSLGTWIGARPRSSR